tara:strand:+ start:43 stop:1512 length:1470 start_codon:yes stop_codon:yes gene_type:complete
MKRTNTVNAPRALDIKGQPHQLSYITPQEAEVLKALGGSGKPGPMGIPSYFGDDFADFEGGGADARGGGSNYDSSPTGQQGPSSSDDSDSGFDYGAQRRAQAAAARQAKEQAAKQAAALKAARDADFARQVAAGQTTIGFTGPRGGTTVFGNTIKGGKISGFSSRDLQNEQTLAQFGFGDERSEAFKSFLSDRGASLKNPFGKKSPGLFGKIFESKDLDYSRSLTPDQRKKTLEANFLNYVNPATKQRFGSILGSAEGEKSLYGDRVKGVRQQSLEEGIAGLGMGTLFPGLGMLEQRERTRFAAPEMLPEGFEQPQGGFIDQFLSGFGGILQPEPGTTLRAVDQIGQAGSDLIQRGRDFGSNLMSGIGTLMPQGEVFTPGVSTAVGSRDPRLDSQPPMPPTPEEEVSTMGGDIQNSFFNLGNDTGGPGTGPFFSFSEESGGIGPKVGPIDPTGKRQLLDPNFEAQFGALKAANDEAIFNNRVFDRTRLR